MCMSLYYSLYSYGIKSCTIKIFLLAINRLSNFQIANIPLRKPSKLNRNEAQSIPVPLDSNLSLESKICPWLTSTSSLINPNQRRPNPSPTNIQRVSQETHRALDSRHPMKEIGPLPIPLDRRALPSTHQPKFPIPKLKACNFPRHRSRNPSEIDRSKDILLLLAQQRVYHI